MSRRRKQAAQIDTGGLDLGMQAASVEAPVVVPAVAEVKEVVLDNLQPGQRLQFALDASPYLRLAARPLEDTDFYLIANGLRFWTARQKDFEPCSVEIHIDDEAERMREDWRPVMGSETGLRLG